jgi:hypothetical protein
MNLAKSGRSWATLLKLQHKDRKVLRTHNGSSYIIRSGPYVLRKEGSGSCTVACFGVNCLESGAVLRHTYGNCICKLIRIDNCCENSLDISVHMLCWQHEGLLSLEVIIGFYQQWWCFVTSQWKWHAGERWTRNIMSHSLLWTWVSGAKQNVFGFFDLIVRRHNTKGRGQ